MRFLFDTNILIAAEPTSATNVEPTTQAIVELLRLVSQGQHSAIVHPTSLREIRGDRDVARRETRVLLVGKYPLLREPPSASTRLTATLGVPPSESHDEVDLLLLSTVEANAVDYLVTEDQGIHRRARRTQLGDRVITVADAIIAIQALFPTVPRPPPLVVSVVAHQLNETDPISTPSGRTTRPSTHGSRSASASSGKPGLSTGRPATPRFASSTTSRPISTASPARF